MFWKSYTRQMSLIMTISAVITLFGADGCYITDCPNAPWWYSGKRQPIRSKQTRSSPDRKCPPCGLRGTGQCFSARMCCTPALGCVIGENEITEPCRYETHIPVECASAGPRCMRRDREKGNVEVPGVCAADGLCCNADGCTYHQICALSEKNKDSTEPPSDNILKVLISGLMKKIHESPGYNDDYSNEESRIQTISELRRSHPRRAAMIVGEGDMY